MNKRGKVINRHTKLKKYIQENEFKDKKKLYKHYKDDIEKFNKNKDTDDRIKILDIQTIYNDLKELGVKHDKDTGVLLLPCQVQINQYKEVLENSLKLGDYRISPPIEIINNKIETNKRQLTSLYKIMIFCDDTSIDIINSIIYKCFPDINILGSTVGFKVLEMYFNNLDDSNAFLSEINSITSIKGTK